MSAMYGKRRVVLSARPNHLGNKLVTICGSDGQGGLYAPIGYWYEEGGLFYCDLKSPEQWYESVSKQTIANKRLCAAVTKRELRTFIMSYWLRRGESNEPTQTPKA
jgi:hypothetical protein